jgi:flagellar secretion chaperone FliS
MRNSDAAAAYRNATFDNAPPIKILRMLYEGAIRFLKYAEELEPGTEDYRKYVRQADEIISELRATLNHEPNPEIAANLESLYLFAQGELAKAYLEGEKEHLAPAKQVLETLLDGWKQAQALLNAQNGAA